MGQGTEGPSAADLSAADRVLAALNKGRLHWHEFQPGARVQFRRPLETEMHRLMGGVTVEHVCEFTVGWEGVSEATLLGAAVGSSDELPFTPALWAAYVRDHADVSAAVAVAITKAVGDHLAAREAAAKN